MKLQLKSINRVKAIGLNLTMKSIKKTSGHEGEELYSGVIYFKNKKVATYKEEDWGGGTTIDIINKENQKDLQLIDKLLKETEIPMDISPEEFDKLDNFNKYKKEIQFRPVTLEDWAEHFCTYTFLVKQAKRDIPKGYLTFDKKHFMIYKKPRGIELEKFQMHIRKENKGIYLFEMEDQDKAIQEYLEIYADF